MMNRRYTDDIKAICGFMGIATSYAVLMHLLFPPHVTPSITLDAFLFVMAGLFLSAVTRNILRLGGNAFHSPFAVRVGNTRVILVASGEAVRELLQLNQHPQPTMRPAPA